MLHSLKERKRTLRAERKRMQCPTLHAREYLDFAQNVKEYMDFAQNIRE